MGLKAVADMVRQLAHQEGGVEALSQASGVSRPALSKWINQDGRDPRISTLRGVLRAHPECGQDFIAALLKDEE